MHSRTAGIRLLQPCLSGRLHSGLSKTFEALLARGRSLDRCRPDSTDFDPMRQQVERWREQQLSEEWTKLAIYHAFIAGELEVPKHLARRVHDPLLQSAARGIRIANDVERPTPTGANLEGRKPECSHCSCAYSALACFRMGMSGSASFRSAKRAS